MKFAVRIRDKKLNGIYITEPHVADRCIKRLLSRSEPCLGFDIETGKKQPYRSDPSSGLCPYRSFPSLVQFYDGIDCVYMFDTLLLPLAILEPIFKAKRLVAHNAIFDAQHMRHAGYPDLKIDCSMIQFNLVRCAEFASLEEEDNYLEDEWAGGEGEGQAFDWLGKGERYGASLRTVTAKLLNLKVDKELQVSNWTNRPLNQEQIIYAAKDAWLTFEVGRILSKKIKELSLEKIYRLNRAAIHPVAQMSLNGMKLDEKLHRSHCRTWSKEKDILEVQVAKTFGSATKIRSVPQISKWLEKNLPINIQHQWPRSEKTGKLRSDAKTLTTYSQLPFVKPLLEYKKLDKLLSTYGESLINKVCPGTSRLHGGYTLGYTATGRLSSRNPNFQNFPRRYDIREIFKAGKGNILVGADYSQIELRVAAILSQDKTMLAAYDQGSDLHTLTAAALTGKLAERVTKEERQLGKSCGFGLLFGLGAPGLVEYARWNYGVQMSKQEAYKYVEKFFRKYPGYTRWQSQQRSNCQIMGTTSTIVGKVRKLQKKGMYTRSVNHPIQGSAAEVVITAMLKLHKELPSDIKLVNVVHDEIILEAPQAHREEAKQLLKDCMESAMLSLFPKATLNKLVEVKSGANWSETK